MFEWGLFGLVIAAILVWCPGSYFIYKRTGWCLLCWVNGLFGVEKVDHERP